MFVSTICHIKLIIRSMPFAMVGRQHYSLLEHIGACKCMSLDMVDNSTEL